MSKPGFFEGVAVALVAGIVISAATFVGVSLLASIGLLQVFIALASGAYICYLMIRSSERFGRLTVFTIWLVSTLLSAVFSPSLLIYVLLQLGMIWIIRSLYYYNSLLASLADLGITGLSAVISLWAWFNTHSLFIAVWSLFLVQALFVLIPGQGNTAKTSAGQTRRPDDRFERAYLAAEQAVRRSFLNHPKS